MSFSAMLRRVFHRCLLSENHAGKVAATANARWMHHDSDPLFEAPNVKQLPVQVRERLHAAEDAYGFIPDFLRMYSRRPKEFSAFFEYHDALMSEEHGNLTRADKELIALVTSAKQQCLYCAVAHGGLLRKHSKREVRLEELLVDWKESDITERQKAILSFAMTIRDGGHASQKDIETLSSYGLDLEDAWDIVAVMALSTMTSYMAKFTDVRPNEQFYKMSKGK